MTLQEVFDQGGCKVGNLVILEGGQHFLIGDCTTSHGPGSIYCVPSDVGWHGWLGKTVLHIFDLLEPQACAILERYKALAAIPGEVTVSTLKGIEDVSNTQAQEE